MSGCEPHELPIYVPQHGGQLRPFQKGRSGNPGGRSALQVEVQRLAREKGPAAIAKFYDLMENAKDERVQAFCADKLLERGFGKPKEVAPGKPRMTLDVRRLTDEQVALLAQVIHQAAVPVEDGEDAPPVVAQEQAAEEQPE